MISRFKAAFCVALVTCVLMPATGLAAPKEISWSKKYRPGQVIIDVSDKRLYFVHRRGKAYSYPVATPRLKADKRFGQTWITKKRPNPVWWPTQQTRAKYKNLPARVAPGDPKNALGVYALNLGWKLIRIHGTNNPKSIGSAASGGCYRMYNSHVKHLAKRVKVGTQVIVRR